MVSELWDKKIESMPLRELKDLQLNRLKHLVKRVYEKISSINKNLMNQMLNLVILNS